jgi:3-oxoacyl-[acyl-carrier-protein] synthase III
MGTIIQTTAIVEKNGFSAIANAAQAGKICLQQAGIQASEVGLLINAGVYRDENIMEPSIASLIQRELNMGLDFAPDNPKSSTFSFDVLNGACSFLNAATIADAFLKNGSVQYALIVSGDSHPSKTQHADFPYVVIGSAALLRFCCDETRGFTGFSYLSDDHDKPSSMTTFGNLADFGNQGRSTVTLDFDQDHTEHYHDLSVTLINQFLAQQNQPKVDFLLGSDVACGFSKKVCESSDLNKQNTRAVNLFTLFNGDVHTAAPIAAFNQLEKELQTQKPEQTVLFSSVGSGNASACALYQR